MKHEAKREWPWVTYYDTPEEITDLCWVDRPGEEVTGMSTRVMEMLAEKEEWYVIVHSFNGSCDNWKSIPFKNWIEKYWKLRPIKKQGNIIGYYRWHKSDSVTLTKQKDFFKADVCNS